MLFNTPIEETRELLRFNDKARPSASVTELGDGTQAPRVRVATPATQKPVVLE